jgi:paired amphipathic helix protein Sin3a
VSPTDSLFRFKQFKSQSIDTPGVIERVSTLFRGHPSLIQGFNTFLPPGYRIECSLDPSENNLITVTTPTGTTTQTPGGVGIAGAINRVNAAANSGAASAGAASGSAAATSAGTSAGAASGPGASSAQPIGSSPVAAGRNAAGGQDGPIMPFTPGGHGMQPQLSASAFAAASNQGLGGLGGSNGEHICLLRLDELRHVLTTFASAAPATPGATAGAGVLSHGSALGGLADPRRPPVEFNHAINYVNKIKQRFSNDPETYKQFLEILQTYQKEQRPIQDVS